MNRYRSAAFTLVELLVVIGIIALLIAILLPSLGRAKEQAKSIKCLSNQREIGKQAATFANDHKSRLQIVAHEDAIDIADPTRRIFEYYNYPDPPYTGSLSSVRHGELLTWTVAYAETAGIGFGKKNWKWGVRADNYDDVIGGAEEAIEKDSLGWATCPSDKIKIGSPGYPDTSALEANAVGGFSPALKMASPVWEDDEGYEAPAKTYYGELSYAINEDIVGAERPGSSGNVIPGCFRGGGVDRDGTMLPDAFGGDSSASNPEPGMRLRGDIDKVFQPSRTLLMVDGGDDELPNFGGNERVMLVNSANWLDAGWTQSPPFNVRANLGSFTNAHLPTINPGVDHQVLPTKRHIDGRLNVLKADFSGETVLPVKFNPVCVGPNMCNFPKLYAELIWITPYDVGEYYDPLSGSP